MYVCGWVLLCGWVFLRMCGGSTQARSAKFVIRSGLQKLADKHRAIPTAFGAAADGLQAVVAELNACNPVQVSHWAILIGQEALRVLFADVFAFACMTDRLDPHARNNSERNLRQTAVLGSNPRTAALHQRLCIHPPGQISLVKNPEF